MDGINRAVREALDFVNIYRWGIRDGLFMDVGIVGFGNYDDMEAQAAVENKAPLYSKKRETDRRVLHLDAYRRHILSCVFTLRNDFCTTDERQSAYNKG